MRVPVPSLVKEFEPSMAPAIVKLSVVFTVAPTKEFVPGPTTVRVVLSLPVRAVVREVVILEFVEIVELSVTEFVLDKMRFPVARRVPPERVRALAEPPMRELSSIDSVPLLMKVPPE